MSIRTHIIEYRIGRNIGTTPMSQDAWDNFGRSALAILNFIAADIQSETVRKLQQWTEIHHGVGTWTDEDGTVVREESAVVSLYTDANWLDVSTFLDQLELGAKNLASRFEQDAVALVAQGCSTLVPAKSEVSL